MNTNSAPKIAAFAFVGLIITGTAGTAFYRAAHQPVTPVAPAPVVETINPDDWQSLANAVARRARRYNGSVGYVIKDLRSGAVASSHAENVFLSASLIKLPIMCAAFQAVEEGRLSLSMPITIEKGDRRGGSGVLKRSPIGSVYTNRELIELMIVHSDNTAAELLIRQLGYDYLQQTFARLGLLDTQIHPEGFKLSARYVAEDNMTSPRDMALLLERIYRRELVSPTASDQMLDILKHQKLRDRLPRFLPAGWQIAHKTGLLRKSCHDVGIVFSPKGEYMICVLTGQDATVARITYDFYQPGGVPAGRRPVYQTRLPSGVNGHRDGLDTAAS
jgi:beta-lactamase class A